MPKNPKFPKRSYRRNIWGNVIGYEGRRRVEEFGCQSWAEGIAKVWSETRLTQKEASDFYWDNK